MRQRRWLEVFKDYDFKLNYSTGKSNMVADALSMKSLHMSTLMVKEMELLEQLRDLSLVCDITSGSVKLGMLKLTSNVLAEIKEVQKLDLRLMDQLELINQAKGMDFKVGENEIIKFRDIVCVSDL